MNSLEWIPAYSVSVSKLDQQHKTLFAMAQKLNAAMREGRGKDVLGRLLSELVAYTNTHFAAEEELLARYKYPALAHHRTEHKKLICRLEQFQKQFEAGQVLISIDLMDFLASWISSHILQSDAQYADHLNRQGVY